VGFAADEVCNHVRSSGSKQNAVAMMAGRKELRCFVLLGAVGMLYQSNDR